LRTGICSTIIAKKEYKRSISTKIVYCRFREINPFVALSRPFRPNPLSNPALRTSIRPQVRKRE
jgi:hypothetical protein